jgi:hypothetical protein
MRKREREREGLVAAVLSSTSFRLRALVPSGFELLLNSIDHQSLRPPGNKLLNFSLGSFPSPIWAREPSGEARRASARRTARRTEFMIFRCFD